MEQTNLPSNSSASTSLQTSSPSNLPVSSLVSAEKIATAISKFGEEFRPMIFERFKKGTGIEKAVNEVAPTFHDVTNFFGEDATLFWLRFHIAETFAFLGIYDTVSKFQVQQTADLIISHEIYGQLTLSEFLSFLNRFKRGDYGKIYNSNRPNPQEFLACLQPFWQELSYYRGKAEEKARQERLARSIHSPDNMTREEYDEIMTIQRMYEMQIPGRL